ncbi:MAG TPA: hypothetical protein VGN72_01535 [Tepidisphaeraceae bacterium]|jgi:hypothetical protein|nr:hypothetical protein [Tepidisphaeraceae bacterium]
MIEFPCRCGHKFQVEIDQAGSDLQCPNCGLLNTVPTLSELRQVESDGTYHLDDDGPGHVSSEDRLRTLHRAFTRNTTSSDGSEIDNRITPDELNLAGDIPLADEVPQRPKYDPVTGELIRPLEIKVDRNVPRDEDIPMAQAAITYAAATPRSTNVASAAYLLTSPGNLAVLGIMFVMHVIMLVIALVSMMFIFVAFFGIFFVFGVIGHFANTIDEIGPRDMDELPRPMRDFQLGEDLWMPFVHVVTAVGLCFGPTYFLLLKLNLPPVAMLTFMALGLLAGIAAFPAVLITTTTSGSVLNLRPDRVMSVVRTGGAGSYIVLVVMGVVSFAIYAVGLIGSFLWLAGQDTKISWVSEFVAFPMLCLGIFLMHLFCWRCGLYYRENHFGFDWVYQRHVPERQRKIAESADDRAARRRARQEATAAQRELRRATGNRHMR